MSENMQNLVVFMEPSEDAWNTPLKGGNMILNRFCIDEDAAFELSGVYSFKKSSYDLTHRKNPLAMLKRKVKGKVYKFLYHVALFNYDDLKLSNFKLNFSYNNL